MRNIRLGLFLFFVFVCSLTGGANAQQIIHVDGNAAGANNGTSWADAYTDLQSAISSTSFGEIWIAAGTYRPAASGGDRNATFGLRSGVALYGGFAGSETARAQRDPMAHPTILSGDLNGDDTQRWVNGHNGFLQPVDNAYHVVTADSVDASAVLDGVTVTHGYGYRVGGLPGPDYEAGGGILIVNASPMVANTIIAVNGAPYGGGVAIYNSQPTFANTAFEQNFADIGSGGGASIDGASAATFSNCTFYNNAAIGGAFSGGLGGAIYTAVGGALSVNGGVFQANYTNFRTYSSSDTRTKGGAIFSYGSSSDIRGARFHGNRSHQGGAIYGNNMAIGNSAFSGNHAHSDRVAGLSASGLGGAIVAIGQTNLLNLTIVDNSATEDAAGVYTSGTIQLLNSIVWHNRVTKYIAPGEDEIPTVKTQIHKGSGNLDIEYSNVQGLFEEIPGEDPPQAEDFPGSIDSDPLIAAMRGADNQAGTSDDDLRLSAGSPSIDTGDNVAAADLYLDLDGNQRFADDPSSADGGNGSAPIVDMGAYEYYSQIPSNAPPQAVATATPSSGTVPLSVNFDGASSHDDDGSIVSYHWTFGDGNTSSVPSPAHTFYSVGSYGVTLKVTDDDGANDTATVTVVVNEPANQAPIASFSVATNGLTATFADTSSDADGTVSDWAWNFGDGSTSTEQNPSHTYQAAGTYPVTLRVHDDKALESANAASQLVTVTTPQPQNRPPVADAGGVNGVYTVKMPKGKNASAAVTLDASGSSDPEDDPLTFQWRDLSDGTTWNVESFELTGLQQGKYEFELTVTDEFGASDTASACVEVFKGKNPEDLCATTPAAPSPPAADFDYVCNGLDCDFSDTSTGTDGDAITDRLWQFGDGSTSTAANPAHGYAAVGAYTVTLTVSDKDGSGTASKTVTVGASSSEIVLATSTRKRKGVNIIDLSWSGASSPNVDIYRDGAVVATVANSGSYSDNTSEKGSAGYTSKVCEAGDPNTCSNEAATQY